MWRNDALCHISDVVDVPASVLGMAVNGMEPATAVGSATMAQFDSGLDVSTSDCTAAVAEPAGLEPTVTSRTAANAATASSMESIPRWTAAVASSGSLESAADV